MVRQLIVILALVSAAGCSATSGDPGPTPSPNDATPRTDSARPSSPPPPSGPPAGTEPRRSPLATPKAKAGNAAGALATKTRCDAGTSYVTLSWRPAERAGTQRVVYSPYADGYRTGRYQVTANLSPSTRSVTLKQLSPGSTYTWLVLTKHGDRWDASASAQFAAPVCAADQISPG